MGIWAQIAKVVQEKIHLSDDQFCHALIEQEKTIVDFLSFTCLSEPEPSPELWKIKKEILELYTKEIAPLLSKIEVYSHDLDSSSVEAIYNLLQYIIAAEFAKDISEMQEFYTQTLSFAYYLQFSLQKTLSQLYFDRLKTYKHMIKNFNHSGVLLGQKPIASIIKEKLKGTKKEFQMAKKRLRSRARADSQQVAEIDIAKLEKEIGFSNLVTKLESALKLYEENLPNIIGNGYNIAGAYKLTSTLINIVSGLFLAVGLLQCFGIWDTIAEACLKLINGVGI